MYYIRKFLPLINALLCLVLLLLLLIDAFRPLDNLFLDEFVKHLVLVICLVTGACGALLSAVQRRRMRASKRRTAPGTSRSRAS